MRTNCYGAFVLLLLLGLSSSQPIAVIPQTPRAPSLSLFVRVLCDILPLEAAVDIGWRLPSGEFLTPDNDTSEIQVSGKGTSAQPHNYTRSVTTLFISNFLSYQHAGVYSCEVRDTATPGAEWITAEVDLQLRVNLTTDHDTQVAVNDRESEVQLSCEMTLFIREDEDLQWFKDGKLIVGGTDRYRVTYKDGAPGVSQKGGKEFLPGRVAVLTISNPEEDDSGTYSCAVAGTEESIDLQLSVVSADDDGENSTSLGAIIGGVVGALFLCVLVLITVAIAIGCLTWRHPKEHLYDYVDPMELGFRSADHANAVCITQSATPQSSLINTHHRGETDQERDSSAEHTGPNSSQNALTLDEDDAVTEYGLSTLTQADLDGGCYSDPRYRGEVNQGRGLSTTECIGPQTSISDENIYTQPDLCGSTTATQSQYNTSSTPIHADLEGGGYSDPRYYCN